MADSKDTLYIDIDDEITGIIDKLRASDGKIVALVLPKRAAVFQSIVNMKLLKRAADDAKKHLVLITSEAGLLPLAGAAGVHVARTLTSKPEIPAAPVAPTDMDEPIEEAADEPSEITADNAGDRPIGELAGLAAPAAASDVETVELDNEDLPAPAAAAGAAAGAAAAKRSAKDKKLAVPNFERFRKWLILAALILVGLIILFIIANIVLPKAVINVQTDATAVNANLNLNLSTSADSLDLSNNTLPAKLAKEQKTLSAQAPATGQQNNGNKAQGTVTLSATECSVTPASDVPAGTGLSANGLTYITQQDTSFSPTKIKNGCIYFTADSSTPIVAQSPGAKYNQSASNWTVAGRSDVSGSTQNAPSGGTDNIVQVVSQSDIDSAKSKISNNDSTMKQLLQNDLSQANYYAISATYSTGSPNVTSSANAGDAASSVTVTENITYSMFGAHQSDLKAAVDNAVKDQIDTAKQSILSEGLDQAVFNVSSLSDSGAQLTMSTVATAGPQLNLADLKQAVAGKKSGDATSTLEQNPDVTGVKVKLSPFWVSSIPKSTNKITINIAKPKPAANNSSNANP